MWIEAILVEDDIDRLLAQLLPMTIDLGSDGDHVVLAEPRAVTFVAGEGVRLECEARVRWSVLGIAVPLTVHDVRAMLRPEVVEEDGRSTLVFELTIDHADFAAIPSLVDARITDKVNQALQKHRLSWDFTDTLSRAIELPASLHPLRTLSLDVAWGRMRVTDEAVVMAISFHSSVGREAVEAVGAKQPTVSAPLAIRRHPRAEADANTLLIGGALLALFSGGVLGGFGARGRVGPGGAVAAAATLGAASIALGLGIRAIRARALPS